MSLVADSLGHGYTILRALVDEDRDTSVPVGVAAWNSDKEWFEIRVLAEDERLPKVTPSLQRFGTMMQAQLGRWAAEQRVPYSEGPLPPWRAGFWSAVSEILTTAIRVDPPRAIDPTRDTPDDLEALFEAVVQPKQPRAKAAQRVDGAIAKALGGYEGFFGKKQEVPAYGGARERVLRLASGEGGDIIVEAVNLAAERGRQDADELVSRVMRIQAAQSKSISVLIGYLASPGGLNGETHMRDWIREKIADQIFDLGSEESDFRAATASLLQHSGLVLGPGLEVEKLKFRSGSRQATTRRRLPRG